MSTAEQSSITISQDDEEIDPFAMILLHSEDPNPPTLPSSSATVAVDLKSDDYHILSINATLSIRQLPSLGISFQLWPAASTLVSLLPHLPLSPAVLPSGPRRQLRILELGSGTGLVGIAAAAILGADVTVTDLGHALPNLRFNAAANATVVASNGGRIEVAEIGWGIQEQMETIGRDFDLILGSDIVYHDHLYEPLLETLKYFLGGDRDLVFFMAHLKRWKKESAFFNKARKMFAVDVVHREKPTDGKRVGVLVYRFCRNDAVSPDKDIRDPEHPCSLEQLSVLSEESITTDDKLAVLLNKMLNGKEGVAAALGNESLRQLVDECLHSSEF